MEKIFRLEKRKLEQDKETNERNLDQRREEEKKLPGKIDIDNNLTAIYGRRRREREQAEKVAERQREAARGDPEQEQGLERIPQEIEEA